MISNGIIYFFYLSKVHIIDEMKIYNNYNIICQCIPRHSVVTQSFLCLKNPFTDICSNIDSSKNHPIGLKVSKQFKNIFPMTLKCKCHLFKPIQNEYGASNSRARYTNNNFNILHGLER